MNGFSWGGEDVVTVMPQSLKPKLLIRRAKEQKYLFVPVGYLKVRQSELIKIVTDLARARFFVYTKTPENAGF